MQDSARSQEHSRQISFVVGILVAGLLLAVVLGVVLTIEQARQERAGNDAIDYILLHGSVTYRESAAGARPSPSQVQGVHVPGERFTDTMVDKLLHLPNLESITFGPRAPSSGQAANLPIEQIPTEATDEGMRKLRARFPLLQTYLRK